MASQGLFNRGSILFRGEDKIGQVLANAGGVFPHPPDILWGKDMQMDHNTTQPWQPVFPVLNARSFNWKEREDVFQALKQLVDGNHPGILTTVDVRGRPHSRWMASLSLEEFPWIYTLTSRSSSKVEQIERHPEVSWMFCNSDLSLILNLAGVAKATHDNATVKKVWKQIHHKEHAYFLRRGIEGKGISVIATRLERVECCTPQTSFRFWIEVDQLKLLP